MDYIVSESQDIILTKEPEEILEIPFKFFNNDCDFLQEYMEMIGNPPYKLIGNLDLRYSNIKSLGNLQHVEGDLNLGGSNIESLGNLQSVKGWLNLSNSKIESLGNLQSVGGSLFLERTPLSKKTTEEEIRSQVDVKYHIFL